MIEVAGMHGNAVCSVQTAPVLRKLPAQEQVESPVAQPSWQQGMSIADVQEHCECTQAKHCVGGQPKWCRLHSQQLASR